MRGFIVRIWIVMSVICLAGCAENKVPESVMEEADETPVSEAVRAERTFDPHVISEEYISLYGVELAEEYYAFCDALIEGRDTFSCSSEEHFHRILSICRVCFPIADKYVAEDEIRTDKGIGYIALKITPQQMAEEMGAFIQKTESVLNEALPYDEPDDILAMELLTFLARKNRVDEETGLDQMLEVSPWRAIMEDHGICQELSGEYIWYLLQAGINAFPCSALNRDSSDAHEWTMIELDGSYYHVDPMFTVSYPDSLYFFGMDDVQREYYGDFPPEKYTYCDADVPDRGKYAAGSRRFLPYWLAESYEIDHEKRTITVKEKDSGKIQSYQY